MINNSKNMSLLAVTLSLILTSCANYNGKFECSAGSGLGCTSAKKTHKLIQNGKVKEKIAEIHKVKKQEKVTVIPISHNTGRDKIKVWLTPQKEDDGSIEPGRYIDLFLR